MKVKNSVELVIEQDEKVCKLICDSDASLGFLYDALSQMRNYVIERINEIEKPAEEIIQISDEAE